MSIDLYLGFLSASILLIIAPGPTNMVIVSHCLKFGFRRSIWAILGAALSHTLFFLLTCLGIATILFASAQVFQVIRWMGVIYLIGWGIWLWRLPDEYPAIDHQQPHMSGRSMFLQGFAVNATNPKALVFYSAFFPPFIDPNNSIVPQLLLLGVTFVSLFIIIAALHGYVADRIRHRWVNSRWMRSPNRIAGSLLIGAGVLLAAVKRD